MVDWDQRYSRKTYVYGEAPSPVVDEAVAAGWLPPPPCRVLLLGEGEGRNAVALAARGYAASRWTRAPPASPSARRSRGSAASTSAASGRPRAPRSRAAASASSTPS